MKYRVQFDRSWQGQWEFEAPNDIRAWITARKFISEHIQVVFVIISEIWEIDESRNPIRKLDNYDDYFIPYKVYFENGDCLLNINKDKDDLLVWNEAIRTIKKIYDREVNRIEQFDRITNMYVRQLNNFADCKKNRTKVRQKKEQIDNQENKKEKPRMFRAHYNDKQCSGPYIAKDDEAALEIGKFHSKFHAKFINVPEKNIRITSIDEIVLFNSDQEKGNNWYIKTPISVLRTVNL